MKTKVLMAILAVVIAGLIAVPWIASYFYVFIFTEILILGLFAASSLCTDQFRHNRNAVSILNRLAPCNLRQGGHHIGKIPQVITDAPRLNLARPPDSHRNTQASFIEIAFTSTKFHTGLGILIGTMDAARMIRCLKIIITPVIAAEKDDGIIIKFQFLE